MCIQKNSSADSLIFARTDFHERSLVASPLNHLFKSARPVGIEIPDVSTRNAIEAWFSPSASTVENAKTPRLYLSQNQSLESDCACTSCDDERQSRDANWIRESFHRRRSSNSADW